MGHPDRLTVPRTVVAAMLSHARAELPNEACGLLAGDRRAGTATSFHAARNEHASPWRFSVHPEDLVRLVVGFETSGVDLVAVFHSHVSGPAEPSATDVRGAAAYPDALHVLATLGGTEPALRAWRIADGVSTELALVVA